MEAANSLKHAGRIQKNRSTGYTFAVEDDVWEVSNGRKIDVRLLKSSFDAVLLNGLSNTLLWYAINRSASSVENVAYVLTVYSSICRCFDLAALTNFRSKTPDYALKLKPFLLKWAALGYGGLGDDVLRLIKNWHFKNAEVLRDLKGNDPEKGSLDDRELHDVVTSLQHSYAAGEITLEKFAIVILLVDTGTRPIQQTDLKVGDLQGNANAGYTLLIPRAKHRGAWRSQFKTRKMPPDTGAILAIQARASIDFFESVISASIGQKVVLQATDRDLLPLFPDVHNITEIRSVEELRRKLTTNAFHLTPSHLTDKVKALDLGVFSRDGRPIHLNARRFRHTIATRAALNGYSLYVVAEMLDHTGVETAQHYFDKTPVIVKTVDAALGGVLTLVARAFMGRLIDSREDATRKDDPASIIRIKSNAVGNCGTHGFCPSVGGVIHCYPCKSFQAWLDGPHELVLASLYEQREQRNKDLETANPPTGIENRPTGVAAALDPVIFYAEQVVLACTQRKLELAKERPLHE